MTYVVSYKLFWNRIGVVRFVPHESHEIRTSHSYLTPLILRCVTPIQRVSRIARDVNPPNRTTPIQSISRISWDTNRTFVSHESREIRTCEIREIRMCNSWTRTCHSYRIKFVRYESPKTNSIPTQLRIAHWYLTRRILTCELWNHKEFFIRHIIHCSIFTKRDIAIPFGRFPDVFCKKKPQKKWGPLLKHNRRARTHIAVAVMRIVGTADCRYRVAKTHRMP